VTDIRPSRVGRTLAILYGAVCYLVFLAAFLYAIGFVGDLVVPRSVDHAVSAPVWQATVVDALLLGLFALQHSVMARPAFKRRWTRFVAHPIERSTYVLAASLVLFLLYWQWRSMPAEIWHIGAPGIRLVVWALFWIGWLTVLLGTFMISHFELFGLRQVYLFWRGKPHSDIGFRAPLLYRVVRHPLMLGFIVAFWAAPTMTAGHLLFALATTAYIVVAVHLEERDLVDALGNQYLDYRRDVSMLVPRPRRPAHLRRPAGPTAQVR
jgi:protein-S-isoprenylcysteine O-methyltransferase Ste14